MDWAMRRRVGILSLLMMAFLLLVVVPYVLLHKTVLSCVDKKQNQGEYGIDCGGPCTNLCRGQAQDLKVRWTKHYEVVPGKYDVMAYVENPNYNIGITTLTYQFALLDQRGDTIAERKGSTYVGPNETFVVFEGSLLTGTKVPTEARFSYSDDPQWMKTGEKIKYFSVTEQKIDSPDKLPTLSATINNMTTRDFKNLDVATVVYDNNRNPIGISDTKIEKLPAKGSAPVIYTWPRAFQYLAGNDTCSTPVDVVLAIDRSGSMASDGTNPDEPITSAKNAATAFVDRLGPNDRVSVVSFATVATDPIDYVLTADFARIKRAISRVEITRDGSTQYTNIGDAFVRARSELSSLRHDPKSRSVFVFLTDGNPTAPKKNGDPTYPETYARSVAEVIKQDRVEVYTVGLGAEIKPQLLRDIATSPDHYYPAARGSALGEIYQQIASSMCKKAPSVIEFYPRTPDVRPH